MGITIHYKGSLKSLDALNTLINTMKERATKRCWRYQYIEENIKGTMHPSWGVELGYIPSQAQIEKEHIEFFSRMVSADCTGYFRLWDNDYATIVRASFRKGEEPHFHIDTRVKGIRLFPHQKCESLDLIFDCSSLKLAHYVTSDRNPDTIHGYDTLWCKTQFAGFSTHAHVCEVLKSAEPFLGFFEVKDEAHYYETGDVEIARKNFYDSEKGLKLLGEALKDVAVKFGLEATTGFEEQGYSPTN